MAASLTASISSLILTVDDPVRDDLSTVKVWASTTDGFTPGSANLVYTGDSFTILLSNLTPLTTYYVRFAYISEIDPEDFEYSTQLSGVPNKIDGSIIVDGSITADQISAVGLRGKMIAGSNILVKGSQASSAISFSGATTSTTFTISLLDTTNFHTSGIAAFYTATSVYTGELETFQAPVFFRYTGKTATTLTGCSGFNTSFHRGINIGDPVLALSSGGAYIDTIYTSGNLFVNDSRTHIFRTAGGTAISFSPSVVADEFTYTGVDSSGPQLTGVSGLAGFTGARYIVDDIGFPRRTATATTSVTSMTFNSSTTMVGTLFDANGGQCVIIPLSGVAASIVTYISCTSTTITFANSYSVTSGVTYVIVPIISNELISDVANGYVSIQNKNFLDWSYSNLGSSNSLGTGLEIKNGNVAIGSDNKLTDTSLIVGSSGSKINIATDIANNRNLIQSSDYTGVFNTPLTIKSVNAEITLADSVIVTGNTSADALRITQTGTGNALVVEDAASPDSTPFMINANGNIVSGHTTQLTDFVNYAGSAMSPKVELLGGSISGTGFAQAIYGNINAAPTIVHAKSRNATIGSHTVVNSGETIGAWVAQGSDGTSFVNAGSITFAVDGTPGTNDMPGRLVFSTTADGASSPTERMRIDSLGDVGIGTSSPLTVLHVNGADGELIRISVNANAGVQQEPALGFATGATNTHPAAKISALEFDASDSRASLLFYTRGDNADSAPTERMRIDSTGNTGIGTSSPSTRLTVGRVDSSSEGGQIDLCRASDNASAWAVDVFGSTSTPSLRFVDNVAAAARVVIDGTGNVGVSTASPTCTLDVTGGIRTSRTAVTSPATTDGNVFSGTYTPTQVSTNTNVDSVTFSECQYMRVGNTITVSGQVVIDATTATTDTTVRMSIPVASNFAAARQLGGVGSSWTTPFATNNLACIADSTNDCVEMRLRPSVNTSLTYIFSFTYRVI